MSEKPTSNGGFNFNNSGSVTITTDGDVISGNKITTINNDITKGNKTITHGFKDDTNKDDFIEKLDSLLPLIRELQKKVLLDENLNEDDKDNLNSSITQNINDLKNVQKETKEIPSGSEIPNKKVESITGYINKTSDILGTLDEMAKKASNFSETISPYLVQILPILASARVLFGIT